MKHAFLRIVSVLAILVPAALSEEPRDNSNWQSPQPSPSASRLTWWSEAKFGMFIHWGPYSLASVEASWPIMTPVQQGPGAISEANYRALPGQFDPQRFDPKAWVRLAKAAGQRYMVITSKHHDGFCMFDSMYSCYKITKTPYGKDVLAMLAAACREENMPLGFYYSPPDLHHIGYRDTSKLARTNWRGEPERPEWVTYLDYMELQLTELLTRYGNIAVIWFDGLDKQQKYNGRRFHKLIHELQPATLINNRIGLPGDYDTPEQFIPDRIPTVSSGVEWLGTKPPVTNAAPPTLPRPGDFRPWETCETINDTWGYNKHDQNYKSSAQLIRTLVDVASKGGNLLLNVGPRPDGSIQPEFQERLLAVGEWLKVNGDAIYGTTYGPWQNLTFGKSTAKGKTIYLHVFDWPEGSLDLEAPGVRVKNVTLLATREVLRFEQTGKKLRVIVPHPAPDTNVSVLAVKVY